MPKPKITFNSGKVLIRRLTCGLSGMALALALAGPGSHPAEAQSRSATSTSGEYQIAYHVGLPHTYRSFYQPYYRPRPRPRRRYSRKRVSKPIPPAKWFPAQDSKDPIQIIISLPEQKVTVYQGGKALVTSRVSTGKPGYSSPSGVFSILQKNRFHRSNIYSNAPMPFMQRLTWSGIALHGSNSVPKDRPASHGCIRLPQAFAGQLFRFTEKGAHVVIANEKAEPFEITHDKLFQPSSPPAKDFDAVEIELALARHGIKTKEKKRSISPYRILVTRRTGKEQLVEVQKLLNELSFGAGDVDGYMGPDTAQAILRFQATYGLNKDGFVSDELIAMLYKVTGKGAPANGHLYVRQDFNPVFDAAVTIRGGEQPLGSHLYTAMHFDEGASETRWLALTLTKGSGTNAYRKSAGKKKPPLDEVVLTANAPLAATAEEALDRIEIPPELRRRINKILSPGSSLAITNDGISKETTPKGTDFIVLMQ